jgi:hypothetical protein
MTGRWGSCALDGAGKSSFESFNGGWGMGQHPYKSSRLSPGLS